MECARQRSFATWRLRIFRQLALSHQPRIPRRCLTCSRAQLAGADEVSSREYDSPRADSEETRPSQKLPQSPILTHLRQGKKHRKRQPTQEDLEPLANNPWAVALASPVRQCTVTGARLPRDLLGEWGLVPRPGTESTYMLPVGTLKDYLRGNIPSISRSTPATEVTEQGGSDEDKKLSGQPPLSDAPVPARTPRRPLVFRMSDHYLIYEVLSKRLTKKSGAVPMATRLLSFRWRHPQGPMTLRDEKNVVWRKDMPGYLLERMRDDVVKKFENLYRSYPTLGAKDGVWNVLDHDGPPDSTAADAEERLQSVDRAECGAVLSQLPPGALQSQEELPYGNETEGSVWMLPGTDKYVPNLNLSVLLGSHLTRLREGVAAQHFQNPYLFFRPDDKDGVEALLALCKLQNYIS